MPAEWCVSIPPPKKRLMTTVPNEKGDEQKQGISRDNQIFSGPVVQDKNSYTLIGVPRMQCCAHTQRAPCIIKTFT